jgi:hypothetical protein
MKEAFLRASDRAARVDEILQRTEREMYVYYHAGTLWYPNIIAQYWRPI